MCYDSSICDICGVAIGPSYPQTENRRWIISYYSNKDKYLELMREFTEYKIGGIVFEEQFLSLWRHDRDDEYESITVKNSEESSCIRDIMHAINEVFSACDVFNPNSLTRTEGEYGEDELRQFVNHILIKYMAAFSC